MPFISGRENISPVPPRQAMSLTDTPATRRWVSGVLRSTETGCSSLSTRIGVRSAALTSASRMPSVSIGLLRPAHGRCLHSDNALHSVWPIAIYGQSELPVSNPGACSESVFSVCRLRQSGQ
jgi:hypothetical protein